MGGLVESSRKTGDPRRVFHSAAAHGGSRLALTRLWSTKSFAWPPCNRSQKSLAKGGLPNSEFAIRSILRL
jgi:hypothetical protein